MSKHQRPNLKILCVGIANYPHGFAEVQRLSLLAQAIRNGGFAVEVISYKITSKEGDFPYPVQGVFEGIPYINTSGRHHAPKGFFAKHLSKPANILSELREIRKQAKKSNARILFISSKDFLHILIYYIASLFLRMKVVLNYVEFYSAIRQKKGIRNSLNNRLFDKITFRLSHAAIPISDYIETHLRAKRYKGHILKIPIVCDPVKFYPARDDDKEKYFCYCGSTNYLEVIWFVLDCYRSVMESVDFGLYLVISGNPEVVAKVSDRLKNEGLLNDRVRIYTQIPETQLRDIFGHAKALLIPLRNSIQDIARFPHKIGEYTATGNPIITTDVGEISSHFTDGESAYIAKEFDINEFAAKMKHVADHEETSRSVGEHGRAVCLQLFDYKKYISPLKDLFENLISRKNA